MISLFFSILCSVTVGVLLKMAKRYSLAIPQLITWNYLFAIILGLILFPSAKAEIGFGELKLIHLFLGLLLPSIFLFLSLSVQQVGLARTDIAQRLSLFISLFAAYFLFKENYSMGKYLGVSVGFLAIAFTLYRSDSRTANPKDLIFPLVVFFGFGIIDVSFKLISQYTNIAYTSSLLLIFCVAFAISILFLTYLIILKKTKLNFSNFLIGAVLGFFNFGNIYFYLSAHRSLSSDPSIVFAGMNMGVITLGSLIGVLIFKEKLSNINYLGLFLAICSIILIFLSQKNVI